MTKRIPQLPYTTADLSSLKGTITFTMIKPSAVLAGHTDTILEIMKEEGFKILAQKGLTLTAELVAKLYAEHLGRYYYEPLSEYMMSGPVVVAILHKEDAVQTFRSLIGTTDPSQAEAGTIRQRFGTSTRHNAVHGADSDDTAIKEATIFFHPEPLVSETGAADKATNGINKVQLVTPR